MCPVAGTKTFFMLILRGLGKQRSLEISRRWWLVFLLLYENRFVSDLGPVLFNTLYIIFALAFFFLWLPAQSRKVQWSVVNTLSRGHSDGTNCGQPVNSKYAGTITKGGGGEVKTRCDNYFFVNAFTVIFEISQEENKI